MISPQSPDPQLAEWPTEELERVTRCPICDDERRTLLHRELRDRIFFVAPGSWDRWRCAGCASGYLDPRPDPASIGLAYGTYYTHTAPPPIAATGSVARLRNALGNGYRNWRFGTDLKPALAVGRWLVPLMPLTHERIEVIYRRLPRKAAEPRRMLDIGCGNGAFLALARDAGWDVTGVEPDAVAREVAARTGSTVVETLAELADTPAAFGYICLNHVIEHLHDPVATLRQCHALLAPGGMLYIDTPNIEALGHDLYGPDWRGLEPPRHLVIFSRAGMELALREAEFTNIDFVPQRDALPVMLHQSARIAARRDPYLDSAISPKMAKGNPFRDPDRAEFLTLTGNKPK